MRRLVRKMGKNQQGISGLETAIILIAFIVIGAIFTYSALSTGLFSIQRSQAAVDTGPGETLFSLGLKGDITASANNTGDHGTIKQISLLVSNVPGGEPIDFTPPAADTTSNSGLAAESGTNLVVINYQDETQTVNNLYWTIEKLGNADDDNLLETNEKFKITIGSDTAGAGGGNLINALTTDLTANKAFRLEVATPAGAALVIERTTPAYIDTIVNLR
jgi:flagellin FlaB